MKFTEDLLIETQETILKDYGVEVSLEETDKILDNLTKYIIRLRELDQSHRNESFAD